MELRKAEQEVDRLKAEWKTLRQKTVIYDGSDDAIDLSMLPSWKELLSKMVDEDIFPVTLVEELVDAEVVAPIPEPEVNTGTNKTIDENDKAPAREEEEGCYFEYGMLISRSNAQEKYDKPAAKSETSISKDETNEAKMEIESDDEDIAVVSAPPPEVLLQLQSLASSVDALTPKIDKFSTRLIERDPITKKPRYGEKAIVRVKKIIRMHKALSMGISVAVESKTLEKIEALINQHEKQLQAKAKAMQNTQQLEAERIEQERRAAEKLAEEERLKEEAAKQKDAEELAQRAQEARRRRLEEEQRAIDEEAAVDRELLASVPVKGPDGVRMQIDRMRSALKDDKKALDTALGSLHTLFDQIVRKPEEVSFRRIRRDHPKFLEDIGRHAGGKEVLIASGFTLEKVDGIACFFSKEPHIESDMDGWSDWFDRLKKTLEVIEEEMIK